MDFTEQDASGKWAWHCGTCGWAGLQCDSRGFASDELKRHQREHHGVEIVSFAALSPKEDAPDA